MFDLGGIALKQDGPPPPGSVMTYPPDDRRPDILAASAVSMILAVLSTIARVAARRRVKAPLKADDYLIFLATFMAVGVVASTIVLERYDLGLHVDRVTDPVGLAKAVLASQILYALSIVPIKLSILALYHRLFPARALTIACYTIGGVVIAYSFTLALGFGLQCIPISALWTPSELPTARCFDAPAMYLTMAIINVLTDIIILSLPIPYIWGLSLQKARKVQLIAVFLLGALVCAFSIIRADLVRTATHDDESYSNVDGAIWSEVEICIGVVSANLPCMRPLFWWLPSAIRGSSATGPQKPGANGYGGSRASEGKRVSAHGHAGAFEMARRSKIIGGGWEQMDTSSDTQPFAGQTGLSDEDDKRSRQAASHVRSVSRQSEQRGRSSSRGGAQSIVVQTTIETSYEGSAHGGMHR